MPLYNVISKILSVQTEVKKIRNFSFGESLRETTTQNLVTVNFVLDNSIKKPSNLNQQYHFFWGSHNCHSVFYQRRILGPILARMLLKDLKTTPTIILNKPYLKWIRVRTNNIFPPGTHLTDVAMVKLIEKGFLPLHCAAVSCQNKGILILAPPNTGKTLTTMLLLQQDFKFISEDISLIQGNEIYGCPYTSTFRYYQQFSSSPTKLVNALTGKIPFLAPFIEPKAKVIQDYVKKNKIQEKAAIQSIVILERGNSDFKILDKREAFRRILNINRYEFNYYRNPMLRVYSYFNGDFDLKRLSLKEEEMLKELLAHNPIYLIRENNPEDYIKHFDRFSLK